MSRSNKDKDQQFKLLADDDPRATLHLFAGLPMDAPAVVTPVGRDIMPAKLMDHAFRVDIDGTSKIHHFEATTSYYYVKDLHTVYNNSVLLEIDNDMAVQTKIVLMSSRGMPEEVPATFTIDRGGSTTRVHRVEFVRVWQIPAALALEQDRLALLPWVILMDATPEQEREAQRRIAASDRARDLAGSMAILAGLRYGKDEILGRLAYMYSLLTEEMLLESSTVQLWLEKGLEKGLEQGRQQEREQARQQAILLLHQLLEQKFGVVPEWTAAKLNTAAGPQLQTWSSKVFTSRTIEEIFA